MAAEVKNGTVGTAAISVVLTVRFNQAMVTNLDPAAILYCTADGKTWPVIAGDECIPVPPGQSVTLTNEGPMWWQGYSASPGTEVRLISTAANTAFSIEGI